MHTRTAGGRRPAPHDVPDPHRRAGGGRRTADEKSTSSVVPRATSRGLYAGGCALHLAPYLSLGAFDVALRATVPFEQSSLAHLADGFGVDVVLSLKVPFIVSSREVTGPYVASGSPEAGDAPGDPPPISR